MRYKIFPGGKGYRVFAVNSRGVSVGICLGDHALKSLAEDQLAALKGGKGSGSGNHGHKGRKGQRGGSSRGDASQVSSGTRPTGRLERETREDSLISFGSEIKALGNGRIGGHLILFGSQDQTDFYGDWFDKDTYVGPNDADGRDVTINHRLPLKTGNPDVDRVTEKFTSTIFKPGGLKTHRDELGIFAEVICDLSDEYDRKVYELAEAGKLKWSSGAARHMIDRDPNTGRLKMFVVAEGALTPMPAEPRMTLSRVMPLKSLADLWDDSLKGGPDDK